MTKIQKYTMEFTEGMMEQVLRGAVWRVEELYEAGMDDDDFLPGGEFHVEFMRVNELVDYLESLPIPTKMVDPWGDVREYLQEEEGSSYAAGRELYRGIKKLM